MEIGSDFSSSAILSLKFKPVKYSFMTKYLQN